MSSFFSSAQVKNEIRELYLEKLEGLSIPYEFTKVETSFGDTNIILTGEADGPPLVLLHGSNGCAPVAIEAVLGLLDSFRVYAVDVVGQPNLSAEFRPNMSDDSYGQWMFEILSRLNVQEVMLVGISFGGFIAWKTLAFDEKRIAKAFFIVPAGIVTGPPLTILGNIFLPMKMYQWAKKERYILRIIDSLFSEPDEFARRFLSKLFMHYKMDFSPIPLIKKEEAKKIKTPIYLVAAGKDLLFPGERLIEQSKNFFPSLQEVILFENSKHVTSKLDDVKICHFIKNISLDFRKN